MQIETECHDQLQGIDGKKSGCIFHIEEAEHAIDAAVAPLIDAIEGLRYRGGCFCEMSIGNPNCTTHTAACLNAEKAIERFRRAK